MDFVSAINDTKLYQRVKDNIKVYQRVLNDNEFNTSFMKLFSMKIKNKVILFLRQLNLLNIVYKIGKMKF